MMDDVLISQRTSYGRQLYYLLSDTCPVPPNLLRSSLRLLVSQGAVAQQAFVQHVRKRLTESPPPKPAPKEMFQEHGVPSSAALEVSSSTRCLFSSKLVPESLP